MLAGAAVTGCRRDAETPIAGPALFPDASAHVPAAVESAKGAVVRAEQLLEVEPNDTADRAMSVSAMAVVAGSLRGPIEPAPIAKPAVKGKQPKNTATKWQLVDQDWFRLPAIAPNQIVQIELRTAPACAELELYDDSGIHLLRKAKAGHGVRAVLPGIGAAAGASLVRVVCKAALATAETTKEPAAVPGGDYQLAIFARAVGATEEVEPNDVAGPATQLLKLGVPWQATMAPEGDIDVFALDAAGAEAGTAVVLNVTGAPDVEWDLQLIDRGSGKPWLARKPARGQGVLIPNLDAAQLGTLLLQVRLLKGQAPDSPYALSLQPYLPPGCARQTDCPDQLPKEREPNDFVEHAWQVAWAGAPLLVSGLLSGTGDVDQLAIAVAPDSVVAATIYAPSAAALSVSVAGAAPLTIIAGGQLVVPALPGAPLAQLITLRASKDGAAADNQAWRIELRPELAAAWEHEAGDEGASAKVWGPQAALVAVAGDPAFANGGWERRGVLWPAGDRDVFGVDLRGFGTTVGLELQCIGDGAPGLVCALQDVVGRELVRLTALPDAAEPARVALAVAPGALRAVVVALPPRPSAHAYALRVRVAPEAASLPLAATAAEGVR